MRACVHARARVCVCGGGGACVSYVCVGGGGGPNHFKARPLAATFLSLFVLIVE